MANALPPGPHGADEFVYLARLDRDPNDWQPYALGVREYHGVDRTDYYTMSAQGITHFLDGAQPEFITAERWELEVANYKKIKSLTVFRTYKKWKSWKLWRKSVMSAKMQRAASVLEKNLFVLDPVFAPTIDKIRDACRELSKKRLSKVRTGEVRTLGAFVDEVKEARGGDDGGVCAVQRGADCDGERRVSTVPRRDGGAPGGVLRRRPPVAPTAWTGSPATDPRARPRPRLGGGARRGG